MSSEQQAHIKYRPDIDGLRAIAILSVFFFHLNHEWLPGGFVGVDIFFVISGFLITSILYHGCQTGQFSLSRFYQRRIARIFPAFFTVALATIFGASLIYTPQDFASAGANLFAACLSLANVKYMMQGSYFMISPDAQPFLHYWSLSVEEQFYLLFPIFLFITFRYGHKHLKKILVFLGLLSLIACILLTQIKPVWAFYFLPARAWELLAGCVLAVTPFSTKQDCSFRLPNWVPILGLLLICLSFVRLHEGSDFPGWKAIVPVLGAVAIICPRSNYDGIVEKWLSSRPMVMVGKLSYTLYLWHWPVFAMVDYQCYLWPNEMRLLMKFVLSILLTVATYNLIECPLRSILNRPHNLRIAYASLAGILLCCIPLGQSIRQNNYVNATLDVVAKGGLSFEGENSKPTVVLMGDSNGSMYGRTMKQICNDVGFNLTVISVAAGDPLPSNTEDSGSLWQHSFKIIKNIKPDYLFIGNAWSSKLHDDLKRLDIAIEKLKAYSKEIVLLNQPPILPKDASRGAIRDGARPPFFETPENKSERLKANSYLMEFESKDVKVIDISHYFEGTNGEVLFLDEFGRQLYHDASHLSGYGVEKVYNALKYQIDKPW